MPVKSQYILAPSLVSVFHRLKFLPVALRGHQSIFAFIQFSSLFILYSMCWFGLIFGLSGLGRFFE